MGVMRRQLAAHMRKQLKAVFASLKKAHRSRKRDKRKRKPFRRHRSKKGDEELDFDYKKVRAAARKMGINTRKQLKAVFARLKKKPRRQEARQEARQEEAQLSAATARRRAMSRSSMIDM